MKSFETLCALSRTPTEGYAGRPLAPRLIRLRDAPYFFGMHKNRFNREVRPFLTEIEIGSQGRVFDRLEMEAAAEDYKTRNGRPAAQRRRPWDNRRHQDSSNEVGSGTSTSSFEEDEFAKALERVTGAKPKSSSPNGSTRSAKQASTGSAPVRQSVLALREQRENWMRSRALALSLPLLLQLAASAASALDSPAGEVRPPDTNIDCSMLNGRGSGPRVELRYFYSMAGGVSGNTRWVLYPCQTSVVFAFSDAVEDARSSACMSLRQFQCFETGPRSPASTLFLVIPNTYRGGDANWTVDEVAFVATPLGSVHGTDGVVRIIAKRLGDSRHPAYQSFLYSYSAGVLFAAVGKSVGHFDEMFVLTDDRGLFAHSD